jgi:hypothetical protein
MRKIDKYVYLDQGVKAGRYLGQDDVRRYQPPAGYSAVAELIDYHPLTGEAFEQSQWWIFLTPESHL